jgi:predicted phosphodiesterase
MLIVHEDRKTQITFDGNSVKFAVVSDTHLGSKYQNITYLKKFYAYAKQTGCQFVLHAGDIVDGNGVYKGQEFETFLHGFDETVQYAVKNYPNGLPTYFITGNHCLSWFNKGGADIGEAIAKRRPDLIYLGQYGAYVMINKVKVYIMHPLGSPAYALSYKIQKLIEGFSSENKPNVLIVGHYHSSFQALVRNVFCMHPASFQGQSPFLRRLAIFPVIGGYIIEMGIDKKGISSFKTEFIPFYQPLQNDY